eukprot:XP_011601011.1 PREDICTED: glycophorin-C isoform X2 [Takifugu rubripes]
MNNSGSVPPTTPSLHTGANATEVASETTLSTTLHTHKATIIEVTTAAPPAVDSAVIAVVIAVIVLTLVVLAFLLYRYLCHNKGAYRTTGELAPGEDPDEDDATQNASGKKEYFI